MIGSNTSLSLVRRQIALRKIILLLAGGLLLCGVCRAAETGKKWQVRKSTHFIIHYKSRDVYNDYVSRVITKAEGYYRAITNYLGFRRDDFWTWDDRCRIYIYPSQEEYQANTSTPEWSTGSVHIVSKEIATHVKDEKFINFILPHELGHIIFRESVGFTNNIPLWIDEGVAVLQEEDRSGYLAIARQLVRERKTISLDNLSRIRDYSQIDPLVFYSEAASIIEFLLEEFGRPKFVGFCRRLRDSENWKTALFKTYPFDDIEELEEAWTTWISAQSP